MPEPYVALQVVMMPKDANPLPSGSPSAPFLTIFGGVLVSYIDQAGAIGAIRAVIEAGSGDLLEPERAEVVEERQAAGPPAGDDVRKAVAIEIGHGQPAALEVHGLVLEVDPAVVRHVRELRHRRTPGRVRVITGGRIGGSGTRKYRRALRQGRA